jgi:predicted HicB family RNase H-like nuclease
MTTRYKNVQIYVDPKDHKELKKKLRKRGISLSSWVREKSKLELKNK